MEAVAISLEAIATSNKMLLGGGHRVEAIAICLEAIATSEKMVPGGGHRY